MKEVIKNKPSILSNLSISLFVGVMVVLLIFVLFCIAIVPAGTVGIKDTFGKVDKDVFSSGFHLKGIFTSIKVFSIKTIEIKETATVPTSEGLIVGLDASLLYHIDPNMAVNIYTTVGVTYSEVVIVPLLRSTIREVTSSYEAKSLYGGNQRDLLAIMIKDKITPLLVKRGIIVENVYLRDIVLPDQVKNAIESKLKSEQEAQQMEFVLQKEQKEAERKIIEAKGIADSQAIIDKTLTEAYLQYLWIQGLKNNPHTIYVPIDQNGLQLFRDVDAK
jgi:regulator of protease activity HflC (stomatin/prohibitin superfamily)